MHKEPADDESPRQPPPVPTWFARATYVAVAVAVAALLLLVAHTLKIDGIQVDTTTLGLLTLSLLVPLAPYITRLSAGDVEAEIGPREARELHAAATELLPAKGTAVDPLNDAPTIRELIARDPPLGLAKLRIDLERELGRLYERYVPRQPRSLGIGRMARELRTRGVLPPEIANPLREVAELTSRAVHGKYVMRDIAEDIAEVGLRVLAALREINPEPSPASTLL